MSLLSLLLGVFGIGCVAYGFAHVLHERPEPPDPNMFGALDPPPAPVYILAMYRHRRDNGVSNLAITLPPASGGRKQACDRSAVLPHSTGRRYPASAGHRGGDAA